MRVFTLLFLVSPALVSAQKTDLLASGTSYKSYADAMFGRGAEAVNTATATTMVETTSVSEAPVAVERTSLTEEKDTLSVAGVIPTTTSIATEVPTATAAPVVEKKIVRKGVGMWVSSDSRENTSYCYALHRTAPIGSVIDLKNPMNGRIVSVKIIGRLPNTESYQGISVVVSAAAARKLHILDKKFIITLMMPESLYAKQ